MISPSMARLVRVEMRKAYDTRAGLWLLIILGVLGAGVVVLLMIFGSPAELTFESYLLTAQLPMGVFLPVLAIVAISGEWSHRTALTTFALVPRRSRIMIAKILALIVIALLAVTVSIAAAAAGNVITEALHRGDGSWGHLSTLGYVALFQVLSVLLGVGLGMLLLSAPQSIVAYLLLPVVVSSLASIIPRLRTPGMWLSPLDTTTRLLGEQMTGQAWAQLAVSCAVWSLLPMLLGAARIQRREVH